MQKGQACKQGFVYCNSNKESEKQGQKLKIVKETGGHLHSVASLRSSLYLWL